MQWNVGIKRTSPSSRPRSSSAERGRPNASVTAKIVTRIAFFHMVSSSIREVSHWRRRTSPFSDQSRCSKLKWRLSRPTNGQVSAGQSKTKLSEAHQSAYSSPRPSVCSPTTRRRNLSSHCQPMGYQHLCRCAAEESVVPSDAGCGGYCTHAIRQVKSLVAQNSPQSKGSALFPRRSLPTPCHGRMHQCAKAGLVLVCYQLFEYVVHRDSFVKSWTVNAPACTYLVDEYRAPDRHPRFIHAARTDSR